MKRIIKKQIYKIEFELASALSIGSGENKQTDRDIIIGSDNKPYIPASAIAGVCISALDGKYTPEKKEYRDYWGYIKNTNSVESSIVFYDAYLCTEDNRESKPMISVRDSVALDEYKTAIDGAKFDMEVLEPGVKFVTYVEQSFFKEDESEPELAKAIANCFKSESIFFGAKTSRGYGAIKNAHIYEYEVNFKNTDKEDQEKIREWAENAISNLNWDNELQQIKEIHNLKSMIRAEKVIKIALNQESGISIRRYTTDAPLKENVSVPDFTQLTLSSIPDIPVIPGTSWAGAFEHQIKKHLGDKVNKDEWNEIFGVATDKKKQKSQIRFSESLIDGATRKQASRTAIDRFSGGAKSKALYTEATYYGGTTTLSIGIANGVKMSNEMLQAMAATIVDLHYGFLVVGGETSIGRGLFSIKSIEGIESVPNRTDMGKANDFYQDVLNLITEKLEGGQN